MDVTTLRLEGRVDTAEAARIEVGFAARAGTLKERGDKAVLDLSELVYLSSMGIRLLVSTVKQFRQRGVAFATIRPREALAQSVLDTANLTDHLNLVEDREAAHALVNQG